MCSSVWLISDNQHEGTQLFTFLRGGGADQISEKKVAVTTPCGVMAWVAHGDDEPRGRWRAGAPSVLDRKGVWGMVPPSRTCVGATPQTFKEVNGAPEVR